MRRVLIAVCGLSPQVITETLFALQQQGRMVETVRVLTTRPGREACLSGLFTPEEGAYSKFLADYGLDPNAIDFSPRHVIAVTDSLGTEIEDIGQEEDNEAFLKACMETAFEHTSEEDTAVYFSIAGGRKTMGACLALAAQIYARPQDRIFHVLVSPEFESCQSFYYPPPQSAPVQLVDKLGHPYFKESKYASVALLPMPFFPLRRSLADKLLKKPEEPGTLMLSAVREARNELVIDIKGGSISWKGIQLDMPPVHLALFAFFAQQKKSCQLTRISCRGCRECALSFGDLADRQEEIVRFYQQAAAGGPASATSDTGILSLSKENFNSYRAKINRNIERRFGAHAAGALSVASHGERPGVRYAIPLDKERIRVITWPQPMATLP